MRGPLAKIETRIKLLLGRAVIRLVDDARRIQELQVEALEGEVIDLVERFQEYGFTSHPHEGAEAVIGAFGGARQHSVVLKVDDRRYRLTGLEEGEVALYTDEDEDDGPHRIVMERGRRIRLSAGRSYILIEDGRVTIGSPSFRGVQT